MKQVVWSLLLASLVLGVGCGDGDDLPVYDESREEAVGSGEKDAAVREPDASKLDAATDAEDAGEPSADAEIDGGTEDAGGDGDADVMPLELEILGTWHTNYGGEETISADAWSGSAIVSYDNALNTLVTQNSATAQYSPGKFNKIVWTDLQDGSFYYCFVDFGLDTAQAALDSTKTADSTDPESSGCGAFPWTKLSPAVEVSGSWQVEGSTVLLSSDAWGVEQVVSYDNAANVAITRNPDEGSAPLKFNKLVWSYGMDVLYVCYVAQAVDSEEDAANSTTSADSSDLTTGCNGGAWTTYDAL